jgi:hypothetical protein
MEACIIEALPPTFSNGMVLEAVRVFPGASSLVDVGDLKPGVKVIKVDGLLPGSAGYLLH